MSCIILFVLVKELTLENIQDPTKVINAWLNRIHVTESVRHGSGIGHIYQLQNMKQNLCGFLHENSARVA